MPALYINQQTEAEKDNFLYECFHDSGVIANLIDSNYTILSGRKGMGKSAIAKYLEKNAENYGVDFVFRLSIRNFNIVIGFRRLIVFAKGIALPIIGHKNTAQIGMPFKINTQKVIRFSFVPFCGFPNMRNRG